MLLTTNLVKDAVSLKENCKLMNETVRAYLKMVIKLLTFGSIIISLMMISNKLNKI